MVGIVWWHGQNLPDLQSWEGLGPHDMELLGLTNISDALGMDPTH